MKHKYSAAALLLAAGVLLAGCTKDVDGRYAQSSVTESPAEESSAAETTSQPETTADSTRATELTTESTGEPESGTTAESAAEPGGTLKILWSERGLEAVAADSEDGYGEELKTGATYLDWTLERFSGTPKDVEADFTYDGELVSNGIVTVLPASHADHPNGLYLRVDNQADFPFFPQDTRERGKFIIENADAVYEQLGLDAPPVDTEYTVAVTVSVASLHVHCAAGAYDTIRVTAASRR